MHKRTGKAEPEDATPHAEPALGVQAEGEFRSNGDNEDQPHFLIDPERREFAVAPAFPRVPEEADRSGDNGRVGEDAPPPPTSVPAPPERQPKPVWAGTVNAAHADYAVNPTEGSATELFNRLKRIAGGKYNALHAEDGYPLGDINKEDAITEAAEHAFLQLKKFDPKKSLFSTWARKVIQNKLQDQRNSDTAYRSHIVPFARNPGDKSAKQNTDDQADLPPSDHALEAALAGHTRGLGGPAQAVAHAAEVEDARDRGVNTLDASRLLNKGFRKLETDRQRKILNHMIAGWKPKEIQKHMGLAERTFYNERTKIRQQLRELHDYLTDQRRRRRRKA